VGAAVAGGREEVRKQFFFEKKNQKTFARFTFLPIHTGALNRQKFFGSFFQKRTASFLPSSI
jgi:hypothetical protein